MMSTQSTPLALGHADRTAPPPAASLSARPLSTLAFAGLLFAALAAAYVLYAFYTTKGLYGSDWYTFYQAGLRLKEGQPVYTVAYGFYNPPPLLLLLRAAIELPYLASRVIWAACSLLMLLASAALCLDHRPSRRELLVGCWLVVCYIPTVLLAPLTGNSSALVVLGFALALRLFRSGYDGWAGVTLTLTLVKPQLAFLVLPLLLYKRRWRAALGYSLVAAAVLALSVPIVGIGNVRDYVSVERIIYSWTLSNDALQLDVPGIHGMLLQHWPHNATVDSLATVLGVVLVGCLAWFWRGPWQPASPRFAAGWSLLLVVSLLIASYAHSYDQVLLIIPAVVLWNIRACAVSPSAFHRLLGPVLLALYAGPFFVLQFHQHFMVPVLLGTAALFWAMGRADRPAMQQHLSAA